MQCNVKRRAPVKIEKENAPQSSMSHGGTRARAHSAASAKQSNPSYSVHNGKWTHKVTKDTREEELENVYVKAINA